MPGLDTVVMSKIWDTWIHTEPALRKQAVGREIFHLNVDPTYGMIVEPKEGGGRKLVPLPESCDPENWEKEIPKQLKKLGWNISIRLAPRSSLYVCTAEKGDDVIQSPYVMPAGDHLAVMGLFISEFEKSQMVKDE